MAPVTRAAIDDFVAQRTLALVGVSRGGKGFGHALRKELTARGFEILLVHPEADAIAGVRCARSLAEIAGRVGGVAICTAPAATLEIVRQAADAGIRRVWMQQGAESDEAVRFCDEHGLAAIHGECLLMFAGRPGFPHSVHRWIRGVLGRLPA